jgi:hypothetical protein
MTDCIGKKVGLLQRMLSALGHGVSRLASPCRAPLMVGLYFPSLTNTTLWRPCCLSQLGHRRIFALLGAEIKGEIMKVQRVVFALMAMMFLFAGKSPAQQVKTDYDRSADFSQYKTYSWGQVKTQDPLYVDRIKSSVNAALAARGWTQVDSGGEVSIVAMEITRNQQTLNTFYDGFGGGWGWRRFGGGGLGEATTTTETYKVGTLVVDLFETKTKKLLWRGTSSDTLSNNSDKNIKNLDKGVEKLFKQFPPGSSKK